jgi:hypothetical protein
MMPGILLEDQRILRNEKLLFSEENSKSLKEKRLLHELK